VATDGLADVTIKLLWLPGRQTYGLRVFAGDTTDMRPFAGELRLTPPFASTFRRLLLAGEATLGEPLLSEVGWVEPEPAA
jgi:hypothetical protein